MSLFASSICIAGSLHGAAAIGRVSCPWPRNRAGFTPSTRFERSTMITSRLPSAALTTAALLSFAFAGQAVAATAHESFTSPADSVASDGFNNLTAGRITAAQLTAGLAANVDGSAGDTIFRRMSGGAYPASAGLYQFSGAGSTFEMAVADAADGLTSIVFQSYINISRGANGVDGLFETGYEPRLSYNNGTQFLTASLVETENLSYTDFFSGQVVASDPNNPNHATFTWNLAALGVTVPVDSFRITFGTDTHSQTEAFQLDQLVTAPVPEPETWALMLGGLGLITLSARRRINKG